jgi:CheY-like chemotaxis protein
MILVVESTPSARRVFSSYLADSGYGVWAVGSGSEALGVLRTEQPAALLLDVDLEDGCASDLIRQARSIHPWLAIVTVSSASQDAAVAASQVNGAVERLTKPVELSDVVAAIDRALAARGQAEGAGR